MTRAFRTRIEGHRAAKRVWACSACPEWAHSPLDFHHCGPDDGRIVPLPRIHHFQSMAEFSRWRTLLLLERSGRIAQLEVHPRYALMAPGPDGLPVKVCDYVADFAYIDRDGDVQVVEDVKGSKKRAALDPVWKLKARHFAAQYGFEVTITAAGTK